MEMSEMRRMPGGAVTLHDDDRVFRGGGFDADAWSVRASVRRGGGPRPLGWTPRR
ncbi:hypothetical protein ACFWHT_07480 [Microbacterium sp. NPDC058342]|uniref:hypothetical protein n=1 Tax=Microbacterium sp. NPDC058342 TaxID=3346454 RepID=UPI00365021FD